LYLIKSLIKPLKASTLPTFMVEDVLLFHYWAGASDFGILVTPTFTLEENNG
jgi:hypothetical protein